MEERKKRQKFFLSPALLEAAEVTGKERYSLLVTRWKPDS